MGLSAGKWHKRAICGQGKEERGVGWGWEIGGNMQRITSETGDSGGGFVSTDTSLKTHLTFVVSSNPQEKCFFLKPIAELAHARSKSLLLVFVTTLTQQAEISALNIRVHPFYESHWNQRFGMIVLLLLSEPRQTECVVLMKSSNSQFTQYCPTHLREGVRIGVTG